MAARARLTLGEVDFLTEVAYAPFAYLMTVDTPRPVLPIGRITRFATCRYDDVCDVEIPFMFTRTACASEQFLCCATPGEDPQLGQRGTRFGRHVSGTTGRIAEEIMPPRPFQA